MSRIDLFNVIRVKQIKDFSQVMMSCGVTKDAIGCEICKPAIGSVLSSLYAQQHSIRIELIVLHRYNEHVMTPVHHQIQDTNDKYLANIQRNGTFSVIPRIAAGEVTPEGLIAIGTVAKKYGLYTKVIPSGDFLSPSLLTFP